MQLLYIQSRVISAFIISELVTYVTFAATAFRRDSESPSDRGRPAVLHSPPVQIIFRGVEVGYNGRVRHLYPANVPLGGGQCYQQPQELASLAEHAGLFQ